MQETIIDFIEEEDLDFAILVGKKRDGEKLVAFYGEPDDFQIIGMARYIFDLTKTNFEDEESEREEGGR